MKKLLILTSVRTGGGHVSLTEAVTEQLDRREDAEYRVVDGFDLMNSAQRWLLADSYGWITRRRWMLWLWRLGYRVVEHHPNLSVRIFEHCCRRRFLALQREFQPDGILAVNPCFVGSIINIMKKAGTEVPLLCMQADLLDIPAAWFDRRTAYNIALTEEAGAYSAQKGIAPERLTVGGFPVRRRFFEKAGGEVRLTPEGDPREILFMGGAEGAGHFVQAARELLANTASRVTLLCGRNEKLRGRLEEELTPRYGERVRVLGFIHNMDEEMQTADLIVMRGSPNSAMEAAAMNRPLMIIDALPGQEAHNPRVLESHGLCVYQPDVERLAETVRALFDPMSGMLEKQRAAQRTYMNPDCAANITEMILERI